MRVGFGREFDDIAVRVTKVNRVNKIVIGNSSGFDTRLLAFCQHLQQVIRLHLQCYMQVEVALVLEVKRRVGFFEEGQKRAIVHLVKTVQHLAFKPGYRLLDFKG